MLNVDGCSVITQAESGACANHGGEIRGIQTEKVNTWFAVHRHIGADIQLRKRGESWKRRQTAHVNVAHPKWNDADPSFAVANVNLLAQGPRHYPTQML